jgi:hypothetical protein
MNCHVRISSAMTVLAFCILVSGIVHAQDWTVGTTSSSLKTPITIQTDVDSALVIIDSVHIGFTTLTIDTLSQGTHSIILRHPDLENWLTSSISDSFAVVHGEANTLYYRFTPRLLVTSNPFGANVFLSDSLIGPTPLVLNTNADMTALKLSIRKQGYEPRVMNMSDNKRSVLAVNLKKIWQSGADQDALFRESHTNGSSNFRLYLTGATTILSGAAAAYFKVRADNRYRNYVRSRDPALLNETNRLDTAAAVALVATQLSLGLFTYFILSD